MRLDCALHHGGVAAESGPMELCRARRVAQRRQRPIACCRKPAPQAPVRHGAPRAFRIATAPALGSRPTKEIVDEEKNLAFSAADTRR